MGQWKTLLPMKRGMGSIPGQGTKIQHTTQQKKKKKTQTNQKRKWGGELDRGENEPSTHHRTHAQRLLSTSGVCVLLHIRTRAHGDLPLQDLLGAGRIWVHICSVLTVGWVHSRNWTPTAADSFSREACCFLPYGILKIPLSEQRRSWDLLIFIYNINLPE